MRMVTPSGRNLQQTGKNWMRNYLKGKHPKTLLEVFSEDDDMPHKGKGKNYPSTPGHPKPIKPKKGSKK
jgi:hypothetical protein